MKKKKSLAQQFADKPLPMNLTPMIDMFTTILIFLMISFSIESKVPISPDVQIPSATAKKVEMPELQVEVTDQRIKVNGEEIAGLSPVSSREKQWQPFLAKFKNVQDKAQAVLIIADKETSYQAVEETSAQLTGLGFSKFYFLTERKDVK